MMKKQNKMRASDMVTATLRLDPDAWQRVHILAIKQHTTIQDFVAYALGLSL